MRLREIRTTLETALKKIGYTDKKLGNNTFQVIGLEKTINIINELAVNGFTFLDPDIKRLKNKYETVYYSKSPNDTMILNPDAHREITNIIEISIEKINGFISTIDIALPEQQESSISVKLPEYKDLSQLSGFFKDLNMGIKQTIEIDEVKGKANIQNFDSGSLWVEIAIYGSFAIQIISGVLTAAQNARQQSYKTLILKTQAEILNLKAESVKDLIERQSEYINTITSAEIDNLVSGTEKEFSPESIERMKKSVKLFSELINEGTQFYPSLNAPSEVIETFPQFQELDQLETTVRRIENLENGSVPE